MLFENHEINIDSLPKVATSTFQQLDENYLVVRYIGSFIFFMIIGFGLIMAYLITDLSDNVQLFWGLVTFWIIWAFSSFLLTRMGYKIRGYVLRDKDLVHRQGVLFKTTTAIPFNRVQHCEVSQGVIQRMFDLHTLQIYTAGGSNSDLSIPGLKADTAQRIKDFIINKTVEHTDNLTPIPDLVSEVNQNGSSPNNETQTTISLEENNPLEEKTSQ